MGSHGITNRVDRMVGKIVCAEDYVKDVRALRAGFDRETVNRIRKEMKDFQTDLGQKDDEGVAIPGGYPHTKASLRTRVKTVLLRIEALLREYALTERTEAHDRSPARP